MATDSERREVAQKLRAIEPDDFSSYSEEHEFVEKALGIWDDYDQYLWHVVADLIEPSDGHESQDVPLDRDGGTRVDRKSEWLPKGIDPMPGVPEVRVLDEDGKEVMRGYYYRHVNRQVAPFGHDHLRPEDVDHCVVYDGFADWNMHRPTKIAKITPPHRIEVIGGIDRDALLALADDMESFGGENDRTLRRMGVVVDSWASCARRIREALGVEK